MFLPLLVMACGDDGDNSSSAPAGSVTLSETSLTFTETGGEKQVSVTAPGEWDASASDSWIKIKKKIGRAHV